MEDNIADGSPPLAEGASGVAEDLQTRARDAWDSVQDQTNRAVQGGTAYVRENPVPAILVAFVLGLVLGRCWKPRDSQSFSDNYIAEPLHRSHGALLGLLVACGALLKRTMSSASSAAEGLAESAGGELHNSLKPLKKAVQKSGRKLGL